MEFPKSRLCLSLLFGSHPVNKPWACCPDSGLRAMGISTTLTTRSCLLHAPTPQATTQNIHTTHLYTKPTLHTLYANIKHILIYYTHNIYSYTTHTHNTYPTLPRHTVCKHNSHILHTYNTHPTLQRDILYRHTQQHALT